MGRKRFLNRLTYHINEMFAEEGLDPKDETNPTIHSFMETHRVLKLALQPLVGQHRWYVGFEWTVPAQSLNGAGPIPGGRVDAVLLTGGPKILFEFKTKLPESQPWTPKKQGQNIALAVGQLNGYLRDVLNFNPRSTGVDELRGIAVVDGPPFEAHDAKYPPCHGAGFRNVRIVHLDALGEALSILLLTAGRMKSPRRWLAGVRLG